MSMDENIATFGKLNQPDLANSFEYDSNMAKQPNKSKAVLWNNIETLMKRDFGKVNIRQFHLKTKLSLGTVQRLKEQETNIGLEVLDHIAEVFGLQSWHLLIPDLDPSNPPLVLISDVEKRFYASIKQTATEFAGVHKRAVESQPQPGIWVEGLSPERRKEPREE
jgi:hypothetical protein